MSVRVRTLAADDAEIAERVRVRWLTFRLLFGSVSARTETVKVLHMNGRHYADLDEGENERQSPEPTR